MVTYYVITLMGPGMMGLILGPTEDLLANLQSASLQIKIQQLVVMVAAYLVTVQDILFPLSTLLVQLRTQIKT